MEEKIYQLQPIVEALSIHLLPEMNEQEWPPDDPEYVVVGSDLDSEASQFDAGWTDKSKTRKSSGIGRANIRKESFNTSRPQADNLGTRRNRNSTRSDTRHTPEPCYDEGQEAKTGNGKPGSYQSTAVGGKCSHGSPRDVHPGCFQASCYDGVCQSAVFDIGLEGYIQTCRYQAYVNDGEEEVYYDAVSSIDSTQESADRYEHYHLDEHYYRQRDFSSDDTLKLDDLITIQVCAQLFITRVATLISGSDYFWSFLPINRLLDPERLLLDEWQYPFSKRPVLLDDGAYFVDADPDMFKYILNFLRGENPPLFWSKNSGHDYPLYHRLLAESDFFAVPRLTTYLKERAYIQALSGILGVERHFSRVDAMSTGNAPHLASYDDDDSDKFTDFEERLLSLENLSLERPLERLPLSYPRSWLGEEAPDGVPATWW
ncbi:uncharacterized protein GIQ15_02697 [Arthroderma uncinatum]|uniref:uncharacterized protein n=1 Tax=Arthroderma uncinatum TaxID=74035 RepID=UPI00144A5F19|nr:uncharacterized protein GIQ15_02697 [Arthroderma uncinatum]KAF3483373.1 hypothetical protein GIQ15_02697 [Arthroderma uncinatum]